MLYPYRKYLNLSRDYLKIHHQNLRSIGRKTYELQSHLYTDLQHVLCITEHNLNKMGMNHVYIENYNIGAQFCRAIHEIEVVVTYVHNSLKFSNTDLSKHSKEKDIEICAVKLNLSSSIVCIITTDRAPSGKFNYFLQSLDNVIQSLYTPAFHIIICGDINFNYFVDSDKKYQLNLLLMYNLTSIVDFPMRINHTSATSKDSIFIDISCLEDYSVIPFSNDLSDHDFQILTIKVSFQIQSDRSKIVRRVDKYTICDFVYVLSNESWDSIFHGSDVNFMFNSFLNTYLRIFYFSFPPIRTKSRNNKNNWITIRIKTSCKRKRELFLLCRNSNN